MDKSKKIKRPTSSCFSTCFKWTSSFCSSAFSADLCSTCFSDGSFGSSAFGFSAAAGAAFFSLKSIPGAGFSSGFGIVFGADLFSWTGASGCFGSGFVSGFLASVRFQVGL